MVFDLLVDLVEFQRSKTAWGRSGVPDPHLDAMIVELPKRHPEARRYTGGNTMTTKRSSQEQMRLSVFGSCLLLAFFTSACVFKQVNKKEDQIVMDLLTCSVITDEDADLTADVPAKYAACRPMPLRQHWKSVDALPREKGVARIGVSVMGLSVHVRYEDSDIFSTATANQQRMWQLGDVVEVFVKPGLDRTDYWEVHVTPNGFLMDLLIPSRAGTASGEHTWGEIVAPESGTTYQAKVGNGWWSAELTIPWSAFGETGIPATGTIWQVAVCRYNYNGGLEDPELSSTAPLTQASYHRYEEYTNIAF